jgi:hypothetical protein
VKLKANAGWLRQQIISRHKFIVILLLLAILLQCVLSMRMKSATFDEPSHLIGGYYYLKMGDFSVNWQNPVFINIISAAPLLFLKPKIQTYDPYRWDWDRGFVHDILYVINNNADQIVFWARIPNIFLSLLLGFFVFRWASELYGIESGLFSLLLYAFSPNILAHSRLATPDLGIACFMFLACYRLWKFGSRPSAGNLLLAGFTLGLALISKFSAVFLLPVYLLFPLVQLFLNGSQPRPNLGVGRPDLRTHAPAGSLKKCSQMIMYSGLIIGIGLLVIIAAYPSYLKPWYRFDETILLSIQRGYPNAKINEGLWHLVSLTRMPGREYALGLLGLVERSKKGHDTFLWGKISQRGQWYYHLVTLVIKTPIALQIMLLLAFGLYLSRCMKGTIPNLYNGFFLAVPPLLLLTAISLGSVKTGLRHVLPVFPFIFVFTASFFKLALERRLLSGLAFLLIVWYFVSSIHIHPHYLAYFNEYVGGPSNGYKYLLDSNLDWGQDLKGLKEYIERRDIEKVKLAYFGTAAPEYYGISYEPISDLDLTALKESRFTRGVFAISATFLQGLYHPDDRDRYKWFRDRTPTAQIGYSIFVYEIDCREERTAKGTAHLTPPAIRHPLEANLGDQVMFLGYDLDTTSVRPDDTLHLTLYWQPLAEMDESYTVFTHLLDEDNRIWGQRDNMPRGGTLPTICWVKGEIIVDEYDIPIQPDAPPGQYIVEVGMYQVETGQRLPIINQNGQTIDDRVVLLEEITVQ